VSGTFAAHAHRQLDALWTALHREPPPASARDLVSSMMGSWGSSPVPKAPPWPSDIGDDGSPFEFSVAFAKGAPDVRFLVEAQGGRDWASVTDAALRLNDLFVARGADTSRLELVRDLVVPSADHLRDERVTLWHTASLEPGPIRVKLYFNPNVRGADQAVSLVRRVFERLGVPRAWPTVEEAFRRLRTTEMFLFSLDLARTDSARIKVYLHPEGATADDLESAARLAPRAIAGEIREFCRAMTGSDGPYLRRTPASRLPSFYMAFTRDDPAPSDVTMQVPIRFYVPDDRVARDRISGYLRARALDPSPYERAVDALAARPLEGGRGLNAWVSLRAGSSPPLVTVYFAAELYRPLDAIEPLDAARSRGGSSPDAVSP